MKITLIFCLGILFFSCDPNYEISYLFENKTNSIIYVNSYSSIGTDEKQINPQSSYLILHHSGMTRAELSLIEYDSIIVSKNLKKIKYYRDSTLRNDIYNMENWEEKKTGKRSYKYTYTFNEEDFN